MKGFKQRASTEGRVTPFLVAFPKERVYFQALKYMKTQQELLAD